MDQHTLTDKQKEIFNFIEEYQLSSGKSPTFKEIQTHFNFGSLNAVFKHINALTKKGYITKNNQARGIDLLPHIKERLFGENSSSELPLYGQIPAGNPETIEGNEIDRISISDYLVNNPENTFLLQVKGDSVDMSGILDGDMVVVNKNKPPTNFDIVVALVDGENTLKQYSKDKNSTIHLKPFSSNPAHSEIIPITEAYIQGVVIGCIRKY